MIFPLVSAQYSYWALILLLFPILTLFGNVLVILAVCRERILQSATNYFIVSLALADLLVAVVVMPFAVYVLVSDKYLFIDRKCLFAFIYTRNNILSAEDMLLLYTYSLQVYNCVYQVYRNILRIDSFVKRYNFKEC